MPGDNGHFFGEHGLYDKRLAYEESIRIPFFVRYPGLISDPGRRAQQMALNIDLAPTLLDLIGRKIPPGMQGRSLVPILRSKGVPGGRHGSTNTIRCILFRSRELRLCVPIRIST